MTSSVSEPFEAVAPYYDLLMAEIPYIWWWHYVETLLAHYERTAQSVLDLCCGTGNLTELVALNGYQVVGVDRSYAMIEQARQKTLAHRTHIPYFVQDASELELPYTFDLVVSLFDSLNNLTDPARFAECMHRVYQHLNPGGTFIFDLNTEYAFVQNLFNQSGRRGVLRYRWRSEYDRAHRICTVKMDFWVQEDASEHQFTEVHTQRAYTDAEVRAMMSAAGFALVDVLDAYTLRPPMRRSDRVFYVGLK